MVEKLLQLLVGIVDAELLEAVLFEDFETGNVEYADEVRVVKSHSGPIELPVDPGYQVAETSFVDTLRESVNAEANLLRGLNLLDPFPASLDHGMKQTLQKGLQGNSKEVAHFLGFLLRVLG